MNTLVRRFVFVSFLFVLTFQAHTQVTITAADVSTRLTLGNVITNVDDTLLTSANIGSPGATSWDFSGLQTSVQTLYSSVAIASTPFAGQFPTATHALKTTLTGILPGMPGAVTGDLYLYIALGSTLNNPGNMGVGTLHAGWPIGDLPGQLSIINSPVDTTYALPMTLGTAWFSTYTATQTIFLNSVLLSNSVTNHDIHYIVDAYGLMKLPGGAEYDALRIRKEERAGGKTIGYIFVAKNGASVQLTAADTLQPNSGVIQIRRKSVTWTLPPESPVPIQLAFFNASLDANKTRVTLTWGTVSEVNNFGFEVQKSATPDGEYHPVNVSVIPGHGTTIVPQTYSYLDETATGGTWYYRLKQIDLDGSFRLTEPSKVVVPEGEEASVKPAAFALSQNYPNPFNPATTIHFELPRATTVSLRVFNVLGQEVATLMTGEKSAGVYDVHFDASNLSSGMYVYRLQAGDFVAVKTLMLLK